MTDHNDLDGQSGKLTAEQREALDRGEQVTFTTDQIRVAPLDDQAAKFARLVAAELGKFGVDGRVQFGPAAGNSIPAEYVEPLLAKLWAAHPALFGEQLLALYAELTLDGLEGFKLAKQRNR